MKKLLRVLLFGALGALVACVAAFLLWPTPALDLNALRAPCASRIFDRYGEECGALSGGQDRIWIPLSDIPEHVIQAFLAAEDQRFYSHVGIDPVRIGGALLYDIRTMSFGQGASTITQQLIKNTHLTGVKTLPRKIAEIKLAIRLEQALSKDEILESYLNIVYFGSGAYGIEAASRAYCGSSASELTLAEGAMLAGIVKAPSHYAPTASQERSLSRRNRILDGMADLSYISPEDAARAQAEPLPQAEEETDYGWFYDAVLKEASEATNISFDEILSGGFSIYTTLDPAIQREADAQFSNDALFPGNAADGTPVEAALVITDAKTGGIRAMVGGRSRETKMAFNRVTDMRRQPGSAIKPVSVYAAAIERIGALPTSILLDEETSYGGYTPRNAGGTYHGLVTMREALAGSYNAAAVSLANRVGIRAVRSQAESFGLTLSSDDRGLALALGAMTHGVTPAELSSAYAALANGGQTVSAHTVTKILDRAGRVVYTRTYPSSQAISRETAFYLTDMLETAATSGTAKALAGAAPRIAGKTGTASGADGSVRDLWICGYTPEYAAVVWMGFDEPGGERQLPNHLGGGGYPARMLAAVIRSIPAGQTDFQTPASLTEVAVDKLALSRDHLVRLTSPDTPEDMAAREYFPRGEEPALQTDAWEAPNSPQDLAVRRDGEDAVVTFTGDTGVEYLLYRDGELIAVLPESHNPVYSYRDPFPDASYTVIPRRADLMKIGYEKTGPASGPVKCGSAFSRLLDGMF